MDLGSTKVSSLSGLLTSALLVQEVCPTSGLLGQVVCPVSDQVVCPGPLGQIVCPEGTSVVGEDK